MAGYTVVDAGTVVATHLNHLMHRHGSSLLGRQEVQQLLERIGRDSPKLVEDLVPKTLSLTALQKVLQGLLAEKCRSAICAPSSIRCPSMARALPRWRPPVASPTSRN